MKNLRPLEEGIKVAWKIVPRSQTTCKRGEYCILFYSEIKDYYLYNAGYMLEQLDLWLASKNIGACWYGMGKTEEKSYNGLEFVIMIAIEKADEKDFRKDYTKAKRKSLEEIWKGSSFNNIASVVRYSPSACNTQPWLVEATQNKLDIYRLNGKRGMMPAKKVMFYNKIDIGIFILFLELCLKHEKISYKLHLISDSSDEKVNLVARYRIINE